MRKRTHHRGQSPGHANPVHKRSRYTTIACNECRKRKTKCSGDRPCRHCMHCEIDCVYDDNYIDGTPKNTTKERISVLENTVSDLQLSLKRLAAGVKETEGTQYEGNRIPSTDYEKAQAAISSPWSSRRKGRTPTQPQFIGPTNSNYNFKMANNTLKQLGIPPNDPDQSGMIDSALPSRYQSPEPHTQHNMPAQDPLLTVDKQEIYHAIEVYKEDLHPVYPFLPIEETQKNLPTILNYMGPGTNQNTCNIVGRKDVKILKMIVASVLVLKGGGNSTLAQRLVDSVECVPSTSPRLVDIDIRELQVLTMTSVYYFHCDEPVLAWRTIGTAARMALEIGLHRRESLEKNIPHAATQKQAVILFWCIYVLDRRWSFGTGMPFVLQDNDIDPSLPVDYCEPYLKCMISYGGICSKVWNAVTGFNVSKTNSKDTVDYLDFQLQQWVKNIPNDLQLIHPRLGDAARDQPRSLQHLRVLLYVRANHMRIFVHRHHILSPARISQNLASAQLVMDIAKDTIRVLVHLRETSTIYETQQTAFNYFLVSAISAIFLGVCHAPAEFSHSCRMEFYSALGLLSALSAHSSITRRLWKSVKGLNQIAPRLGLAPTGASTSPSCSPSNRNAYDKSQHQKKYQLEEATRDALSSVNTHHVEFSSARDSIASASMLLPAANKSLLTDAISLPEIPDTFQIGSDLTALFEAMGHHNQDGLRSSEMAAPVWVTEETSQLQEEREVSQLFEGLL